MYGMMEKIVLVIYHLARNERGDSWTPESLRKTGVLSAETNCGIQESAGSQESAQSADTSMYPE